MDQSFHTLLQLGGKTNSLGNVPFVIKEVIHNKHRMNELYSCLFDEDTWVRMRAADALEKICREHPDWLMPFIEKIQKELSSSSQPSIQWHIAQIYRQVSLTDTQRIFAISWLEQLLNSVHVDWIVSANAMDTLVNFLDSGYYSCDTLKKLLAVQQNHPSKSVRRRAQKILDSLNAR